MAVTVKGVPAITELAVTGPLATNVKVWMAAGITVNVFEVLTTLPLVVVRVFKVPARVSVTECELNTPEVKLAVVAVEVKVELVLSVTFPTQSLITVLVASRAVIFMVKACPAVWVPMSPVADFSIKKLVSTLVVTDIVLELVLIAEPLSALKR